VSAASVWEATIKSALGKLKLPERLPSQLAVAGFVELPISIRHAESVAELPPIHADPFDRLLIAQARCENLSIVSSDGHFTAYPVEVIWS
jgi:PIN domain nuclease of toxin-antitoxin system